jgi:hypothetical protein
MKAGLFPAKGGRYGEDIRGDNRCDRNCFGDSHRDAHVADAA